MKLAQAIEAGMAYGLPQYVDSWFTFNSSGRLCACAMGRALLGAGVVTLAEARMAAEVERSTAPPWDEEILYTADNLLTFAESRWPTQQIQSVIEWNDGMGTDSRELDEIIELMDTTYGGEE